MTERRTMQEAVCDLINTEWATLLPARRERLIASHDLELVPSTFDEGARRWSKPFVRPRARTPQLCAGAEVGT